MMQTMCDLILGEIQIEIDRVQKDAVSEYKKIKKEI